MNVITLGIFCSLLSNPWECYFSKLDGSLGCFFSQVLELFGACTASGSDINEHKLAWLVYIMGALVGGNTGGGYLRFKDGRYRLGPNLGAGSMRAHQQQQQQSSGAQPLHVGDSILAIPFVILFFSGY